jgi:hypothetical protein
MQFGEEDLFEQVPDLRPAMNVGCLFDIPIGNYYNGQHGESILNGGLQHITGVCGIGNSYKSTVDRYLNLSVANRYEQVNGLTYDSEFSLNNFRINSLAQRFDNLYGVDMFEAKRWRLTDGSTLGGDYWDNIRALGKTKQKMGKKAKLYTPFWINGKQIEIICPTLLDIDSMSQMAFGVTESINEAAKADAKEQNAMALRDNLFKSRILGQLPNVAAKGQIFTTVVAHMGEALSLDPNSPPAKKLAAMKAKLKFKRVPENFTFLTNNLYYCSGATPHLNQADKTPYFPKDMTDRGVMDQDLQKISVQNLRAKSGPSGIPFTVIVSQSQGLLPALTEYTYLRSNKKVSGESYPMGFGLTGNDQKHSLDLIPDVILSRTKVRGIFDESFAMRRALEITSEMAQMQLIWKGQPVEYKLSAAELLERLVTRGYSMDVLLNTRGYWVFEGSENPLPFLSTMDLLKMANDEYHPYWMKKDGFTLASTCVHMPIKKAQTQEQLKEVL